MKTIYHVIDNTYFTLEGPDDYPIYKPFTVVSPPKDKKIAGFDWVRNEWIVQETFSEETTEVIKKMMASSELSSEEKIALSEFYPNWEIGLTYKKGDIVRFDEALWEYFSSKETTATEALNPKDANYLWHKITIGEDGVAIWKRPEGYQDVYKKGDIVLYTPTGKKYESLIDGNSQEPTKDEPYNRYWKEI